MSARSDEQAQGDVCVMWLCESEQVMLRPGMLYRFEAKSDCSRCTTLAAPYMSTRPGKGDAQ